MKSAALLSKVVQNIRASYWFLPSILVLAAFALAQGMLWVDRNADLLPFQLPSASLNTQIDDARATLSVVAQSIIGITGVMFSMTIVAVSFASGNYGPRLIGNFMRDRGTQWSLGVLISTFVYALLILRSLHSAIDDGGNAFVPQYSILVAVMLAVASVFTTIFFIHHIPELINVSNITAALGRRLSAEIKRLIDQQKRRAEQIQTPVPDSPPTAKVSLSRTGYVQALNFSMLCELSESNNWVINVISPPGSFVTEYSHVLEIWSDEALGDEMIAKLGECYALGDGRTEKQNVLFLVDQLVEMVARALSPGVNDPHTAINCLNWLHAGLQAGLLHNGGLRAVRDGRVHIADITFPVLLEAAFGACRAYVKTDELAAAHYQSLLTGLAGFNLPADSRKIITQISIKT